MSLAGRPSKADAFRRYDELLAKPPKPRLFLSGVAFQFEGNAAGGVVLVLTHPEYTPEIVVPMSANDLVQLKLALTTVLQRLEAVAPQASKGANGDA